MIKIIIIIMSGDFIKLFGRCFVINTQTLNNFQVFLTGKTEKQHLTEFNFMKISFTTYETGCLPGLESQGKVRKSTLSFEKSGKSQGILWKKGKSLRISVKSEGIFQSSYQKKKYQNFDKFQNFLVLRGQFLGFFLNIYGESGKTKKKAGKRQDSVKVQTLKLPLLWKGQYPKLKTGAKTNIQKMSRMVRIGTFLGNQDIIIILTTATRA